MKEKSSKCQTLQNFFYSNVQSKLTGYVVDRMGTDTSTLYFMREMSSNLVEFS